MIGRVIWEHRDATGLSGRSSYENGAAETLEGGIFAPVETDAIGNNMGTRNPYIEPPPSSGGSPEMEFDYRDRETYINGQQITCTLDGVPVKCNTANNLLNNRSIARLETYGLSETSLTQLGIITITIPGRNVAPPPPGEPDNGGAYAIADRTAVIFINFNVSWDPQQKPDNNVALVDQAVKDVKKIFEGNNECSRFFQLGLISTVLSTENGKTTVENFFAIDASAIAERLGNQLRSNIGFLDVASSNRNEIAIEQSGRVTDFQDADGRRISRVFERAKVNINGGFIKGGRFGSFSGRAGRALAFLHEIAHLIVKGTERDKKGNKVSTYLIPNDKDKQSGGKDLSVENTELIERKCKTELEAIKALDSSG